MAQIDLDPVHKVRITILMDNVADPLIPDQGSVDRINWPKALTGGTPRISTPVMVDGTVPDYLIAEPGFSALVRIEKDGRECTLLFDTGVSPTGLVENMRRLDLSLDDVEVIVLSHGHWDHVTGIEGVVKELGRARLPVLIHPEFWTRRRISFPGMDPAELPSASKPALEGAGFDVIEQRQPSFLFDDSVLITGEVDRTTEFETGFRGHEAFRANSWVDDPLILDDQAIVLRVRTGGLVVLSGCGHAGIVNTVRYAMRLTGESRIAAVIGGFHLSGPMFEPTIGPTVSAFDELAPTCIVPAHCTGWRAVHQFAARFPDAFVQSTVGTTIEL